MLLLSFLTKTQNFRRTHNIKGALSGIRELLKHENDQKCFLFHLKTSSCFQDI